MFDDAFVKDAINRSAENRTDRRRFLQKMGLAGLGVAGANYLVPAAAAQTGPSDSSILNFALNLEYLEAEFYLHGVNGEGLPGDMIDGQGEQGRVVGGREVNFQTKAVRQYAREIAGDELDHVRFLRSALGSAAVARPRINIQASFTAAAQAAGLIGPGETFDPYANEDNFLLAAFIFEDVGVTAYKGAAPLIDNPTFLEAAAGLLAVEAYHAANIRTTLFARGLAAPTMQISNARDSLDGSSNRDQGAMKRNGRPNIVPTDGNGLAYSRTPGQVLNIVFLTPESGATSGGFFPRGVNGELNTTD